MTVGDMIVMNELMPSESFAGLWDSIHVEESIKDRLLRSLALSLRLRSELPFETTALHGLALLYGPPGTGKTTLARGVAHQLAPLTKARKARFIEINPHGLMSAEHGQSQKKVSELLTDQIPMLADDGLATVVLLDEVESMAVARSEASLAANPADVHRATDAVLAALDANTSRLPHVVIVATSNFTGALDAAFLSRADVAIEVPLPDKAGVLSILKLALSSMSTAFAPLGALSDDPKLQKVAETLVGQDGRRIRKLVTEAMLGRIGTVLEPGELSIDDLLRAAKRLTANEKKGRD